MVGRIGGRTAVIGFVSCGGAFGWGHGHLKEPMIAVKKWRADAKPDGPRGKTDGRNSASGGMATVEDKTKRCLSLAIASVEF